MTPFIVIGILILFFTVAFSIRLKAFITYDEKFQVSFKYLFIPIRMNKEKKGKDKEAQEKKKPQKADVAGLIRLIQKYYSDGVEAVKTILKRLSVDKLRLNIKVCEQDAAKTAILYGEACAVVYSAAGFLSSAVSVKKHEIEIKPLFNGGQSEIEFECVASMRLGQVIMILLSQSMKILIKLVKETRSKIPAKDGAFK